MLSAIFSTQGSRIERSQAFLSECVIMCNSLTVHTEEQPDLTKKIKDIQETIRNISPTADRAVISLEKEIRGVFEELATQLRPKQKDLEEIDLSLNKLTEKFIVYSSKMQY